MRWWERKKSKYVFQRFEEGPKLNHWGRSWKFWINVSSSNGGYPFIFCSRFVRPQKPLRKTKPSKKLNQLEMNVWKDIPAKLLLQVIWYSNRKHEIFCNNKSTMNYWLKWPFYWHKKHGSYIIHYIEIGGVAPSFTKNFLFTLLFSLHMCCSFLIV